MRAYQRVLESWERRGTHCHCRGLRVEVKSRKSELKSGRTHQEERVSTCCDALRVKLADLYLTVHSTDERRRAMRGSLALLTLSIVSTCLAADNEIRNKANNLLAGHFRVGNEHDQAVSRLRHVTHVAAPTPTYTVEKEEVEEADGGDEGYVTILKRVKLPKATSSHVKSVMSTLTPVEERPPPPDIRDTIRAVSPFLAAVIRHPLRYSSLIIRSILWAIWKVVRFVFGFAWVLLRPFVVPVYIATVLPVSLGFSLLGEVCWSSFY